MITFLSSLMDFALIDSDSSIAFAQSFERRMLSENSLNNIRTGSAIHNLNRNINERNGLNDESIEPLGSNRNLAQWMCIQHNLFHLDALARGKIDADNSTHDEQWAVYEEYEKSGQLFECTHENLKKRWGGLNDN